MPLLRSAPEQLEIAAEADADTWPLSLGQTLTVGSDTRIEFKRESAAPQDAQPYVDVEMPREQYLHLRERLKLEPGQRVHLRPRRVTRFETPFDQGAGI